MLQFKMSEEQLNKILQYLITKPYHEVAHFVVMLQQAERIKEPENAFELVEKIE